MSSEPTLQLYSYFRSSAAFRVRIALHVKELAFDTIGTHLLENRHRTPEYLSLNPQGLVPALGVEGTVLSQSLAIIEYLDERYPDPPLLPRDPLARAQIRSMTLAIACDIHPLNNLRVLNYLRDQFKLEEDIVMRWYHHWIATGFTALETQVRAFSANGRYCYGDAVSLADVYLVPQMFNARRFKCDVSAFSTLNRIVAHLEALPAFQRALPENQPDAA
jgi:maleylacetoacetate isomerase